MQLTLPPLHENQLPWEMTPFWGWESDGKEEDIPECDLVPF